MRLNPEDYPWIEIRPHRNIKRVEALNDIDIQEQLDDLEFNEREEPPCGQSDSS